MLPRGCWASSSPAQTAFYLRGMPGAGVVAPDKLLFAACRATTGLERLRPAGARLADVNQVTRTQLDFSFDIQVPRANTEVRTWSLCLLTIAAQRSAAHSRFAC